MKIVHLCNYYQELLGYQEYYLAHAQMTNGHDVHIVTGDRYFPFPSYETTVLAILGPRIVGCGLFSASKITIHRLPVTLEIASRVWLKDVIQRICDINPDLIICHGVSNFNALRLAVSKIVTAPVVFDEHMLKREMRGGLLSAIYYKIFRNLVAKVIERRATAIVGVAEGCIDFLRDEMGFSAEKLTMIPLGTDVDLFVRCDDDRIALRKTLGVLDTDLVIVFTGKLTHKKAPHLVVEALEQIVTSATCNCLFLCVGDFDTAYKTFFWSVVDRGSIRVIHHHAVDNRELPKYFSAADIAIWPVEATISMIEAMACSLPIICCDGLRERLEYNNGFQIDSGNLQSISSALHKLVFDAKLRTDMGARSRLLAIDKFSWQTIAAKFANLI